MYLSRDRITSSVSTGDRQPLTEKARKMLEEHRNKVRLATAQREQDLLLIHQVCVCVCLSLSPPPSLCMCVCERVCGWVPGPVS
jgi:hypothetical protein